MLENIVRHMEMGKPRLQAALDGSKEIAFTIVSMTLSLAAVFIPILFMGGIVGRLMHEFAVDDRGGDSRLGPRLADADADAVQPFPEAAPRDAPRAALQRDRIACSRVAARYGWTLKQTIRFKAATMRGIGRCCSSARSICSRIVPKGFIPSVDTGQLNGQIEAIQGIGFEAMVAHQRQIMDIVAHDPNVASFTSNVGGGRRRRRRRRLNVD